MDPKKEKRTPSLITSSSCMPISYFGEHELISWLSIQVVESVLSNMGGERLHQFEPP